MALEENSPHQKLQRVYPFTSRNHQQLPSRSHQDTCLPEALLIKNNEENTPLHLAIYHNCHMEIIKALACPEALLIKNKKGKMPLNITKNDLVMEYLTEAFIETL